MEEVVSIIVPVYGAADYIAETVDMVKKQTYSNWELILIDDCSPDNSVEVITDIITKDDTLKNEDVPEDGTGRIRLIRKAQNEGAAGARNTGLSHAKGRYIAFLDADDIWLPDKLEKELAYMRKNRAAFVFTAYEFGDEQAKGTGRIVSVPKQMNYKKALSRTVIFTSTVLFDTKKIDKNLLQMPAVASEDTATWWKILRSGYTAYGLNEVLVIYRRPKKSLSSNKFVAIKRIWHLYREEEKLSLPVSAFCFVLWAVRAAARRL